MTTTISTILTSGNHQTIKQLKDEITYLKYETNQFHNTISNQIAEKEILSKQLKSGKKIRLILILERTKMFFIFKKFRK